MITVCEQNKDRIANQVLALKNNLNPDVTPIFVYGNQNLSIDIPYTTVQLDVEERYSNLYKKIFKGLEHVHNNFTYDYVIKIDDDTLVNYSLLDKIEWSADYIGREHSNFSKNVIDIDLPMYNIRSTINLYPPAFKEPFSFMTGDFYALSKACVNFILENKNLLKEFKENSYVCEDQLIGYILKNSSFTRKNICFLNEEIENNVLQITEEVISLHPVSTHLFPSLLSLTPRNQLAKLIDAKRVNYWYRKSLLQKLEEDISSLLINFANSKKTMGLG
jgi:hypothetical protein